MDIVEQVVWMSWTSDAMRVALREAVRAKPLDCTCMTVIDQFCPATDGSLWMRTEVVDEDPCWHGHDGKPN